MIFGLEPLDLVPFFGMRGVESPLAFGAAIAVATLLDLAIMLRIVRKARPRPVDFELLAQALGCGFLAFVLEVPVLTLALRFTAFGLIYATFCFLTFAVAPVAIFVAVESRRGRPVTPIAKTLVAIGLAIVPCAAYARLVEPFRLQVERHAIDAVASRRADRDLRIGVLADLQTDRITAYERHVIDVLMAEQPDLILIPGDLFHGLDRDFEETAGAMNELLAKLDAPLGVFFVTGDVDPPHYVERLFRGTKIRSIDNQTRVLDAKSTRIVLCGLYPRASLVAARTAIAQLESTAGPDDLRVVFAHHPDDVMLLPDSLDIDLMVAGHTHGGQIVIPGFGWDPLESTCRHASLSIL